MSARTFRERFASLASDAEQRTAQRRVQEADDWPAQPGGRFVETPFGPLSVHQQVYSGPEVRSARQRFAQSLTAGVEGSIDPAGLVVLDTETTGLAGGTGTWVFLVGLGRFSGDDFVVRQLFMRHPGDEPALIATLAAELARVETIITYNGRSFDLPLIDTRFRMHGRALPSPPLHLDLLSASRAIWKHRLASCALGEIERAVLGVERELDAPGWMIPQLYFGYLRSRNVESLQAVFEHNRMDIVSLARLAALVHGWECGLDAPSDAIDALALALHRVRRTPNDETLQVLHRLVRSAQAPAELRLRALRELSTHYKRHRRDAVAAELWQAALRDPSRAVRLFAAEELAKYLEHRERDHAAALAIATAAAEGARLARDTVTLDAFRRRIARLERKLGHLDRTDTWAGEQRQ